MKLSKVVLVGISTICGYLIHLTTTQSLNGGYIGDSVTAGCGLPSMKSATNTIEYITYLTKAIFQKNIALWLKFSSVLLVSASGYLIGESVIESVDEHSPLVHCGVIFSVGLFLFSPTIWRDATTFSFLPANIILMSLVTYLIVLFRKYQRLYLVYWLSFVFGFTLLQPSSVYLALLMSSTLYMLRRQLWSSPCILWVIMCCLIGGSLLSLFFRQPNLRAGEDSLHFTEHWAYLTTGENSTGIKMKLSYLDNILVVPFLVFVAIFSFVWDYLIHTAAYEGSAVNTTTMPSRMLYSRTLNEVTAYSGSPQSSVNHSGSSSNLQDVSATSTSTASSKDPTRLRTPTLIRRRRSLKAKGAGVPFTPTTPETADRQTPKSSIRRRKSLKSKLTHIPLSGVEESAIKSPNSSFKSSNDPTASVSLSALTFASTHNVDKINESAMTPLFLITALLGYLAVTCSFHTQLNNTSYQILWSQSLVLIFYLSGVGLIKLTNTLFRFLQISAQTKDELLFVIFRLFQIFALSLTISCVTRQYVTFRGTFESSMAINTQQYATAILAPLPRRAILVTSLHHHYASVRYVQLCEGYRLDVTLVNLTSSRPFTSINNVTDVIFPAAYYSSPDSEEVQKDQAFTFYSFFRANSKKRKVFLTGQLPHKESLLKKAVHLVPFGLSTYFVPLHNAPNASYFKHQTKRILIKVLSVIQVRSVVEYNTHPSGHSLGSIYLDEEFKDRITDIASYMLEVAKECLYEDAEPLIFATYLLETSIALHTESVVPSKLLKKCGLAHVHLLNSQPLLNRSVTTLPFAREDDVFQSLDVIHWPESTQSWKDWSATRFETLLGAYLKRDDARQDPEYSTVESIYSTAITQGENLKVRILKRRIRRKPNPRKGGSRQNRNPWAKSK